MACFWLDFCNSIWPVNRFDAAAEQLVARTGTFDVKYFWESVMRIYQRKNGVWYIEYSHRKRRSLETKDKAKALRELEKSLPLCAYCEKKPIAKNRHKYCSDKCRESAGTELQRYGALRRKMLDSFKNRCAICSAKRSLTVHFVDNTGTIVSTVKGNNDGLDIVVICRSCRSQVQTGNRVDDILPGVSLFEDFTKKAVSILQNAAINVRDL